MNGGAWLLGDMNDMLHPSQGRYLEGALSQLSLEG